MWVENFPRLNLAHLPTPVQKMENISRDFEDVELYIKRDDLTGLAYGGNKVRKLEFLLGKALEERAKAIITEGGPQSNHARMTAAAGAYLGLETVLVLEGDPPREVQGNILLDKMCGARILWSGDEKRTAVIEREKKRLQKENKKPVVIPTGGSTPTGALGYVLAAEEIKKQEKIQQTEFDYILAPIGSGGTHAGLLLGKYYCSLKAKIMGIGVVDEEFIPLVDENFSGAANLIGYNGKWRKEDLILNRNFVGPGYGFVDDPTIQAVKYLARKEGVFTGPVYTGKALRGLFSLLGEGFFPAGSKILFLHTGGSPEVFAFNCELGGE